MRSRKARLAKLTKAELRVLASVGLVVTMYTTDGKRATVEQLAPEASSLLATIANRCLQKELDERRAPPGLGARIPRGEAGRG